MRILVLATTFPRWRGDTEPAFVLDLSRTLVERGHHIVALVPHAAGAAREEIFEGAGPVELPTARRPGMVTLVLRLPPFPRRDAITVPASRPISSMSMITPVSTVSPSAAVGVAP